MIVLVDTREQRPYTFEDYPDVETATDTLKTGDYTVLGHKGEFAVERKSQNDFLASITWERKRFKREVKRASQFSQKMKVVVEYPWEAFMSGNYYRDVPVNSIRGTVRSWQNAYNVVFEFCNNRLDAERVTYQTLAQWSRAHD